MKQKVSYIWCPKIFNMQAVPFTIERVFDAAVNVLWKAMTDKDEMKQWYFDLKEFKAEPGFRFSFTGGKDDRQYLHLCEVIDVIPIKNYRIRGSMMVIR
jgi:uncharacterized protein YndB with AHSA1/START domain